MRDIREALYLKSRAGPHSTSYATNAVSLASYSGMFLESQDVPRRSFLRF